MVAEAESMDMAGFYKFDRHADSFEHDGVRYTYHNSGLTKNVYVSEDRKWVIKFPASAPCYDFGYDYTQVLCEAEAWEQATAEERQYLAETHFLEDIRAIKQEFVDVVTTNEVFWCRELGVTADGRTVVFDMDGLFEKGERPYQGYNYYFAKSMVERHLARG